ncbi:MAG TPA: histidine phosphatase family protein [Microvirga sp.]|jgi:broad specificity phosphatase PhoE
MSRILFITHPEVVIDPAVPIPEWPLSPVGRQRMEAFTRSPVLQGVASLHASTERKAMDGAEILGKALGLGLATDHDLGENDRSSTGFIAPPEFWEVVEAFFARPTESIRGWERAVDAQSRIVRAVRQVADTAVPGDAAIVAHGGVASLLMAHLRGTQDARPFAQPRQSGGCFFVIDRETFALAEGWSTLENAAA